MVTLHPDSPHQSRPLFLHLSASIYEEFGEGGWITLVITTVVIGLCFFIRRHYRQAVQSLRRLDEILVEVPLPTPASVVPVRDTNAPTAVFFINGYNGLGLHSVLAVPRLFGTHCKNFIFVGSGIIDSSRFKGDEEIENLRNQTKEGLQRYVAFMKQQDYYAAYWYALGTEPVDELERLATAVAKRFPRTVFFAGKLIFQQPSLWDKILHNQTAFTLQRRLQFAGLQMRVLPIRVG